MSAPAPALADKQVPGQPGTLKELEDRLRCMESILKYHFPDLALDIDSLRRSREALASRVPRPAQNDNTMEPSANAQPADNSPDIENEDCTIDSVDDMTVRTSSSAFLVANPLMVPLSQSRRLFG